MVDGKPSESLHRDEIVPADRWAFDAAVTEVFDDMLARSIPQYEVMRQAVFSVGSRFVEGRPNTSVVALGCSRGADLEPFVTKFGAYNRYVGVDVSEPMLAAARERFAGYAQSGLVEVRRCDLRDDYPPVSASLTLAVLTLQFTPIEYRASILSKAYQHTVSGGGIVVVEKVLGSTSESNAMMVDLYLASKRDAGYTPEQINAKRHALEGVLVPVTAMWNQDMLQSAGFRHVDCFWRWMNFAAFVGVKA